MPRWNSSGGVRSIAVGDSIPLALRASTSDGGTRIASKLPTSQGASVAVDPKPRARDVLTGPRNTNAPQGDPPRRAAHHNNPGTGPR